MTRRRSGFTLIEVLVALVVLGFLMVGLAQGMRFELTAWNTGTRVTGGVAELDTVDRALRRLIAHMDPGLPLEPPLLVAEQHTLAFTTELPEAAGAQAAQAADVSLGVDGRHRLVLRWRSHFPGGEVAATTEMELLRGVDHVDFAYWNPESGVWLPRWPGADTLPALVRIGIVVPAGQRPFPPVVVATMRDRPQ
jgi:general secretion pathway protein J